MSVVSVFDLASEPIALPASAAPTGKVSYRPTGALRDAVIDSLPAPEPVECEAVLQVRAAVVAELEVLRLDGMLRIGDHPPPAPPPHRATRERVPVKPDPADHDRGTGGPAGGTAMPAARRTAPGRALGIPPTPPATRPTASAAVQRHPGHQG